MAHSQDDGLAPQRTKVERFDHCTLLYLYRSRVDAEGAFSLIDSPVILTKESMISVHRARSSLDTAGIVGRLERDPAILAEGVPALLWSLLDSCAKSSSP